MCRILCVCLCCFVTLSLCLINVVIFFIIDLIFLAYLGYKTVAVAVSKLCSTLSSTPRPQFVTCVGLMSLVLA